MCCGVLRVTDPRSRARHCESQQFPRLVDSGSFVSIRGCIPVMFDDLNDLYQQVILDHCKKPRNFHELPAATCSAQGHNPLCGDQLKLFLQMDDEVVKDISFVGSGCCISKASASILTDEVKGKSRAEVKALFDKVHDLVTTGRAAGDVGKLTVFAGVYKYPARVKCAILAWHAVMAALKGEAKPVTTESEQI
jgi:nitrogen fixation NifU-like protein